MKIKLLIASDDIDYSEHLSKALSNNYSDMVQVCVCSSPDKLCVMMKDQKYDVALFEASFCESADIIDTSNVLLPLVLWADNTADVAPKVIEKIRKYQRISVMLSEILENYAKVSARPQGIHEKKANIVAAWSPSGGVGKTTVALALAASEAAKDKQVIYINLESFSSVPAYFDITGKSISSLFEMLETKEGNLDALIQSLLCKDPLSGIAYFCCPDSFDDMNILSSDNISVLLGACSALAEEVIVDMSCLCDERTRDVFELADRIFLVSDRSSTAKAKLEQFFNSHNVLKLIEDKVFVVANKGAVLGKQPVGEVVSLPMIESVDETGVFKALAASLGTIENGKANQYD